LEGLDRLYGELGRLERALRAAVAPLLRPRLGAGDGKFAASVAARTGAPARMCAVPAAEARSFFAPLPARLLPLAPEAIQRLARRGLRTIGDLARLPFSAVQAQLGAAGARAWRLANGRDDEPVVGRAFDQPIRASLRVVDPIASVDATL